MYQIENESCKIAVKTKGSELCSLYDKERNREYVWQAGQVWPKHAPILFPTIGGFAGNTYLVNGKPYTMSAHGFARDREFTLVRQTDREIVMRLQSDAETHAMYPYDFTLLVSHRLEGKRLTVTWTVENTGKETMYYSIGAHPGFQFAEGTHLNDYVLKLDRKIPIRTRRVQGRLVYADKETVCEPTDTLPLTPELLRQDAIILEEGVEAMTLACEKADYRLRVSFPGFPVVAVWSMPSAIDRAEYVCIEPWCGINDFVGQESRELKDKYRIERLEAGHHAQHSFSMEIL